VTIFCVSSVGYDIRPCSPEMRPADRGFLCQHCYDRVIHAYEQWPRFAAALDATEGRPVQSDNGGVRSSRQLGYINLPLTLMSKLECEGYLRSLPDGARALDMWVATEAGAFDAIRFAHAAERAYRDIRVEERPSRITRVRCPNCSQLTLVRKPPEYAGAPITVPCSNCEHTITEGDTATTYKQTVDGWQAVSEETIDVIAHIETRRT
jgi:ribosomal protein S27E